MDINKLVDLAHAYRDLGWAVQEQLGLIVEEATFDSGTDLTDHVNANAARMIATWAAQAQDAGVEDADLLYDAAANIAGI